MAPLAPFLIVAISFVSSWMRSIATAGWLGDIVDLNDGICNQRQRINVTVPAKICRRAAYASLFVKGAQGRGWALR